MKKIVLFVLIIIMLLILCSCGTKMSEIDDKPYENEVKRTRFIEIERYEHGNIVIDSETNVEYWLSDGVYNAGTLTMLVDEHGNPKVRK